MLSIIVAYDAVRGIGQGGQLPWPNIKEDFKHFKRTTLNHPIIMGRKTWESLPLKPLPDRRNIVVSRHLPSQDAPHVCRSLEEALTEGMKYNEKVFLIGGGELYREALKKNLVDEIIATEVKGGYISDTFFPVVDWAVAPCDILQKNANFNIVVYKKEKHESIPTGS